MSRSERGPTANPGFQLWHATTRWRQAITVAMEDLELTRTQFFLLGSLDWLSKTHPEPPSQRELADHTGLDVMTASQVIRTLERRGFVTRREDPADRRADGSGSCGTFRGSRALSVEDIDRISRWADDGACW